MRTLRLARVAAEAEGLRLRQQAQRTVMRLVYGIVALGFLVCAVVFLHIALWAWLRWHMHREYVALVVAGVDIVLLGILVFLAARSSPGRVEIEAKYVRDRAWENALSSLTISTVALQSLGMVRHLITRSRSRH